MSLSTTIIDKAVRLNRALTIDRNRTEGVVGTGEQLILANQWRQMVQRGEPLPSFREVGFRAFSQNEEDGILLFIFSVIGATNRLAVELCVEEGIECIAANLIVHHGWHALLFDGSEENMARGRDYYAKSRYTWMFPPKLVAAWVDAETINDRIQENGFEGPIDLLSIDIDGMDYWVWKAIKVVQPRVVVIEYQPVWGPEDSYTIPYKRDFSLHPEGRFDYTGGSLAAYVKLGKELGFRLVGSNRYCNNAFFIRNDIAPDLLPEVSVASCLDTPRAREKQKLKPVISKLPWVEI